MAGANADAGAPKRRQIVIADQYSRVLTAVRSKRPFAERLVLFWSNHFTVSVTKGAVQGLSGAMEREAIRPNISAKFETLLRAA